jgi:hypothetical protein
MHDPAAASISASARSSAGHRQQAHPGARRVATALTQKAGDPFITTLEAAGLALSCTRRSGTQDGLPCPGPAGDRGDLPPPVRRIPPYSRRRQRTMTSVDDYARQNGL